MRTVNPIVEMSEGRRSQSLQQPSTSASSVTPHVSRKIVSNGGGARRGKRQSIAFGVDERLHRPSSIFATRSSYALTVTS